MSFIIHSDVFDAYYDAVDAMIDSNFGVDCTLIYPADKTVCSNCHFNSVTKSSSNQYKSGGPIPFEGGICPYCSGQGYVLSESTETIKLRCYFDKKSWMKIGVNMNVKDGSVVTYGHAVDMPKCIRSAFMTANIQQAGYGLNRYELSGQPMLHGFKRDKYFIAIWNRAE